MINKDELLFTVNDFNNPLEPMSRNEVHRKGIWHRVVQIWIINDEKQILCQKRSLLKDNNPGKWEAWFGGHLGPNQKYEDCGVQELKEEIGIQVFESDLNFFTVNKYQHDKEFQGVYYMIWNGNMQDLKLEKEEVDQVKWFEISKITNLLIKNKDKDWVKCGYEKEMLQIMATQ